MVLQKHNNPKREIISSLSGLMKVQTRAVAPLSAEETESHRVAIAAQAKALGIVLVDEPVEAAMTSRKRIHPMG